MAQIPNLQSTNTLGEDDQAILRQGTIDKRIGLNLAGILSWARRNEYTHLGEHTTGIQFSDTVSFTTYQGKTYFVKSQVALPYTATSNVPSSDTNLYSKEGLSADNLSKYTDIVYKASGGNSAVEIMILNAELGENCTCEHGSRFKRVSNSGGSIYDFECLNFSNVADFGDLGDGSYDATAAWTLARDFCISGDYLFFQSENMDSNLPTGIDLFGVRYVELNGRVRASDANTDEILVGYTSLAGAPSKHVVNNTLDCAVRVQGISNGDVTIGNTDLLTLYANGSSETTSSVAYTEFYIGFARKMVLECDQGAGVKTAFINENKIYGGRLLNFEIKGDYPCNNNIWYGTKIESFSSNIQIGYSNFFYDCRLEGVCNFTFGPGTFNNHFYRSYYQIKGQYYRNKPGDGFGISDQGQNNGVFDSMDAVHNKDVIFKIDGDSTNINLNWFDRFQNTVSTTAASAFVTFYDSGLVRLDDVFSLNLLSRASICAPRISFYDQNGAIITSEPAEALDMIGKTWRSSDNVYDLGGALSSDVSATFNPVAGITFIRYTLRTGSVPSTSFGELSLTRINHKKSPLSINSIEFKNLNRSSVPSTGYFNKGEFVENNNKVEAGSSPNKYILQGWDRLTNGSSHALGTDWVERRSLTGN